MRARELRKKYFEYYVQFEYETRRLCNRMFPKFRTAGISLAKVVDKIRTSARLEDKIKSEISKHKNTRNWLAHKPSNKKAPQKTITNCKNIKKFLVVINQKFK